MRFSLSRRNFLKMLGFGSASTALSSCSSEPIDKIIPYLIPPEEAVPGIADWYATLCRECPSGCGLLAKIREGRPIKVEGNPHHPVNRGGLCMRGQASLQSLFNPDRIRTPMIKRESGDFQTISWKDAEKEILDILKTKIDQQKTGEIAVITPLIKGSLERLLKKWMDAFHIKNHLIYEPISYEDIKEANRIVFSKAEIPLYSIEKAEMILSFGADFLETWISPVEYSKAFGNMKRVDIKRQLIYIGQRMSLTAANADEWISLKPGTEKALILGLIHFILKEKLHSDLPFLELELIKGLVKDFSLDRVSSHTGVSQQTIERIGKEFSKANPGLALGGGIAVKGLYATDISVAVNLLNYICGNIGRTVRFGHEIGIGRVNPYRDMLRLIESIEQSRLKVLLLYNVNLMYNLPDSSGFQEAIKRIPHVISISQFMDDTAKEANLIIPSSMSFEEWGDYMPRKGVFGLQQPVIKPLFESRGFGDILLSLVRSIDEKQKGQIPWNNFHDYLKNSWKGIHKDLSPEIGFDHFWEGSLRRGGVFRAETDKEVKLSTKVSLDSKIDLKDKEDEKSSTLLLYPSIKYFDGRGANKPLLQEISDPLSKIAWDTYLEMNPETAVALKVVEGDFVSVESKDGRMELPVHIYEGIRKDVVAVPLGLGHIEYGRYAKQRGVNPINLLSKKTEEISGGVIWSPIFVKIERINKKKSLASTQGGRRQFGRGIAQALFFSIGKGILHLKTEKDIKKEIKEGKKRDMYKPHPYPEHKWGMVIDLNACIGCSACVAACYMENNIGIVGEREVIRGREMEWIRIEKYVENKGNGLDIRFVPMLCQHCENAPCEPVCPVYAAYHNPEGLNAQIYNRCVGTRYCSNNCPYKVRRFNWFSHSWPEPLNWQLNPDVTVREVGVMEKCTFCIQRIREKKEVAKEEGRRLRDGEIIPACAQTCPTEAIVFGDLKDPKSRVSKLWNSQRGYRVLEEINTKPSVVYLKKIKREI